MILRIIKWKIVFCLGIMLAFAIKGNTTRYYLSVHGNDLNEGIKPSSPWRTIQRMMEVIPDIKPGDSILFERGSVFTGELIVTRSGTPSLGIYIGAYGSGPKPVISGAVRVANWLPYKNNTWVAMCPSCSLETGNLFVNGSVQPLGRYPDEGYLLITSSDPSGSIITDSTLNSTDNLWTGAEMVVQSSRWTLDKIPVASYKKKSFSLSGQSSYPLHAGSRYFIQRHAGTLNQPGEWHYDPQTKQVFLFTKSENNPNQDFIEISSLSSGISIKQSHDIYVENLVFRFQSQVGIRVTLSNRISIHQCDIGFSGINGVEVDASQNTVLSDNSVTGSNNNGIEWHNVIGGTVIRNTIRRTGMVAGRGANGNGAYCALRVESDVPTLGKNTIEYNLIDSTGYLGIDFRTSKTIIKNNRISNFCMIKDDGAAVYTWNNFGGENTIEGNIISQSKFSQNKIQTEPSYIHGIYIDDRSSGILVNKNTVSFCPASGIFIHNAKKITLTGNTLFGNGMDEWNSEKGQLLIMYDDIVPRNESDNTGLSITGNTLVTIIEGTPCYYVRTQKKSDIKGLGKFDNNQFIASNAHQVFSLYAEQNDFCDAPEELDLFGWQQLTRNETNSRFDSFPKKQEWPSSSNLIKNGNMTQGANHWITWPDMGAGLKYTGKIMDGTVLQIKVPVNAEVLLYQNGFTLDATKTYRLSFTAKSIQKGTLEFVPLMASSPWGSLGRYACFSLDTISRTFTILFKPLRNCANARMNFKSKTSFWIDNITLHEVIHSTDSDDKIAKLLCNSGDNPVTISLNGKVYFDLHRSTVQDSVELPAYTSQVLLPVR